MDHYFLDILYSSNSLYKMDHDSLDRHYLPTYTCTYVREVLMLFHIVTVRTAYLGKKLFSPAFGWIDSRFYIFKYDLNLI